MHSSNRFGVLDTYRYLAATGVVLHHAELQFGRLMATPTHYGDHLALFVDFFFALSGFVLMHTYGERVRTRMQFLAFMRKRLARIYPLHLALTLLVAAIGFIALRLGYELRNPDVFDLSLLPANLLLVHAWGGTPQGLNGVSWSISAEFFVYILFPLFAVLLRRGGVALALVLAVVFVVAMQMARDGFGLGPWTEATNDFGNCRAIPTFLVGMAAQRLIASHPQWRASWPLAHGLAALILLLLLLKTPAAFSVALMPLSVALIALAERAHGPGFLGKGLWLKLGDASYGVYMTHSLIFMIALAVMRKFGLSVVGATPTPILIAATLIVAFASSVVAVIVYELFENPLRKRLGGGRRQAYAFSPTTNA